MSKASMVDTRYNLTLSYSYALVMVFIRFLNGGYH